MNLIEYTNCLKTPRKITKEQSNELEKILIEYPYFQSARFLLLNGLKNQNSYQYNNELKKTAAYTTDRSVLFDYISSVGYNYNQKDNLEHIEIKNLEVIKDSGSDKSISLTKEMKNQNLPLGKPLQFDKNETFSFNEWLNLTSVHQIKRDNLVGVQPNTNQITTPNQELIDKFITAKPKLKPSISGSIENIASASLKENQNLMTETLAHVYLEQKKYNKAITAFEVLSLKYPEKSSFFANQIEEVKKLQEK